MKKVFISGASGFQGRPIAEKLLGRGYGVSTLTRSNENSIDDRIDAVEGSFEFVESLHAALNGVDVAVFTLPLVFDLEMVKTMTNNFIQSAIDQNVELVVFNSSFDLPESSTGYLALDLKVEVKRLLDESDLQVITISPDVYIDNLTAPWSIPLILEQGILPYPVKNGQKIPWISHEDLAKFIIEAIEKPEYVGKSLPIGGNIYSGDEIAEVISQKIGKPVQFIGITPDDFEKNLAPGFGELAAREIANLYRYLGENIDKLNGKSFVETQEALGIKLQTLEEWANSVQWN